MSSRDERKLRARIQWCLREIVSLRERFVVVDQLLYLTKTKRKWQNARKPFAPQWAWVSCLPASFWSRGIHAQPLSWFWPRACRIYSEQRYEYMQALRFWLKRVFGKDVGDYIALQIAHTTLNYKAVIWN